MYCDIFQKDVENCIRCVLTCSHAFSILRPCHDLLSARSDAVISLLADYWHQNPTVDTIARSEVSSPWFLAAAISSIERKISTVKNGCLRTLLGCKFSAYCREYVKFSLLEHGSPDIFEISMERVNNNWIGSMFKSNILTSFISLLSSKCVQRALILFYF